MKRLLVALLLLAAGTTAAAADPAPPAKVLVIGFDGMDPQFLRDFAAAGELPRFARLMAEGDFAELGTAMPPQSPVAWSDFITGMDPGGHGIFDFIHRDPQTLVPYLSAAQAMSPQRWWKVGGWKIPRESGTVELLRHGKAFWELMAEAGVDVTVFKVPSNFPPVECEARTLSGMGTPDILGTYGIFSFYTDAPPRDTDLSGGRVIPLEFDGGRSSSAGAVRPSPSCAPSATAAPRASSTARSTASRRATPNRRCPSRRPGTQPATPSSSTSTANASCCARASGATG